METSREGRLPPPPGLITSLQAGFDVIARHVYLILLPAAFDLLLWLGPHLRIEELMRPGLRTLLALSAQSGASSSDLSVLQQGLQDFTHGFNMIAMLRTLPIGLPSLNYGRSLLDTPFRAPLMIEITNMGTFVLLWASLTVLGWLLGSLFYHWIADVTAPAARQGSLSRTANSLLQGVLLCLLWALVLFLVSIPISLFLFALALISVGLAQVVLLLGLFAVMWLLPLIFFSGHGIFAYQQNVFQSIGTSFRMTRFALPSSALFILAALLISEGLRFLWRVPPAASWLTLVGILGHAFVTTALLAASFVYYRNTNSWLQVILERLKAQPKSISA